MGRAVSPAWRAARQSVAIAREAAIFGRRLSIALDAKRDAHAAAQMERFRTMIREQTLSAISRRRQPAPPTPN